MSNILLTGANGFIGRALISKLHIENRNQIYSAVRKINAHHANNIKQFLVEEISADNDWSEILTGVDYIIHAAARVHVMLDASEDPMEEFRKVNTYGTLNIARQAAKSGIKRFIYLSSIKVNGEKTLQGTPFTPDDVFIPFDPYALSKYEAEQGLLKLAEKTQMEVVIIRPPLVYGPGVKANFLSMMKWLYKGIPLPFGSIHNKRSLVALDNLVDLILTCIEHPNAANEIFLVSDGEDLSTTELLMRVSHALGKKYRLLPVNQKVLEFCLLLIGKKDLAQRLCGSLQVDISKAKELLNWTPPVSVDEGLRKTADHYIESQKLKDKSFLATDGHR